jgi:hypothetical protein
MTTHGLKDTPKFDYAIAIQSQAVDGRATCWSNSNDVSKANAPGKMFAPLITAWIEQRNDAACCRVSGGGVRVFESVAPKTRPGKIVYVARPTRRSRNYMLSRIRVW